LPRSLPVITMTLSFFRIGVANLDILSFQLPAPSFQLPPSAMSCGKPEAGSGKLVKAPRALTK
jgi:hypothetical protein